MCGFLTYWKVADFQYASMANQRLHFDVFLPTSSHVFKVSIFQLRHSPFLLGLFWGLPRSHRLSRYARLEAFVIQTKLTLTDRTVRVCLFTPGKQQTPFFHSWSYFTLWTGEQSYFLTEGLFSFNLGSVLSGEGGSASGGWLFLLSIRLCPGFQPELSRPHPFLNRSGDLAGIRHLSGLCRQIVLCVFAGFYAALSFDI